MTDFDVIVAGAGVVGIACARALALSGRSVLCLDRAPVIGAGTSSRNSEVIHAGLYYPPESLKARACIAGRDWLYRYCAERGVPHRRTGKLIVAAEADEVPRLEAVARRAEAAGAGALTWLDGRKARRLEPALTVHAALLSPMSGIIDGHALMFSLQGDAEQAGALFVLNTEVIAVNRTAETFAVGTRGAAGEHATVSARAFVNAAGLDAARIARHIDALDAGYVPPVYLSKGCYFAYARPSPFARLVYPAPHDTHLGIHVTLDMAGRARFGPDHEWVDTEEYGVPPERAALFAQNIARYFPGISEDDLLPDYAGIRPKVQAPGEPMADFRIDGTEVHGVSGLVNLFGIESPGLTAAPALAELVRERINEDGEINSPPGEAGPA